MILSAILMVLAVGMLLALVVHYGLLHCVGGTSIVDHSTTNKVNVAALSMGTPGETLGSEASVQTRDGIPLLIGCDAVEDAAPTVNELTVSNNCWESWDTIVLAPDQLTTRDGPVNHIYENVGKPRVLKSESDWSWVYESTGAVDQFWMFLLSYGTPLPDTGGHHYSRKGAITAADYSTTGAFGTAVSITDLDPSKIYRIAGLFGVGGTDCGIIRLSAGSFRGMTIQAIVPQGHWGGYWFPYDSLVFAGNEALSVAGSGGAASTMEYHVILEEYGEYASAGATGMSRAAAVVNSAQMTASKSTLGARIRDVVQKAASFGR